MKLDLIFHDWMDEASSKSLRYTEKGVELSLGDFHSGTMFSAEIELEDYQGEFEAAAKDDIVAVFYALVPKERSGKSRTHWPANTTDLVLQALKAFWAAKGFSPSIRDIMEATGITSTSVVSYHIVKLERAGIIKRTAGVARSYVLMEAV